MIRTPPPAFPSYCYTAEIVEVYDGDTCVALVDLGMRVFHRAPLRLARIDAPELKGATRDLGAVARDWLRGRVLGQRVLIQTDHDRAEKYGRWLAEIWVGETNINDALVAAGHAQYRVY